MKIILITFVLFLGTICFGQGWQRKAIAGTRLTVELPENMDVAKHTPIVILEQGELTFTEIIENGILKKFQHDYDPVNFRQYGVGVLESLDLTVDNYPGKLFIVESERNENAFLGYFGDSTFAVMYQGVFSKQDPKLKNELLRVLRSIQVNRDKAIDWDDFLSFRYSSSSIFKLNSNQNHNLGIHFTPNGVSESNMFAQTNIMCLQFPPSESIHSAEDIAMETLVPQLAYFDISEVFIDKQSILNGIDSYCFNAVCKKDEHVFELYSLLFYSENACVFAIAYIIDGQYNTEAKEFMNNFKLKKDGF